VLGLYRLDQYDTNAASRHLSAEAERRIKDALRAAAENPENSL
jgi:hypothetical protein